jgi:signal transduction histidine kinase
MNGREGKLFMTFIEFYRAKKIMLQSWFGVLLFFLVTWIDFITGPELAASIFYLLPITLYCNIYGTKGGVTSSIIGAILWFLTDIFSSYFAGHSYAHPAIPYWNALVRFGFFYIISVIFVRLQTELKKQKVFNAQLAQKNIEIMHLANIKVEFATMISHELRTPLTAIKENLAIVYDGSVGPLTMEQKDFLETVKHNVDRLSRLINDILDFQRLESRRMQFRFVLEDINQLVLAAEKNFRAVAAKKGLDLIIDIASDIPMIEIDRDRINQVLSNLIQNAIRYSDKGSIILSTRVVGQEIHLSVEDQGYGIKPEEMPKLFQSFQRLSSSVAGNQLEGTGLGLAISKRIIEAHNGKINVTSRIGEGSVFKIILPYRIAKEGQHG